MFIILLSIVGAAPRCDGFDEMAGKGAGEPETPKAKGAAHVWTAPLLQGKSLSDAANGS
jgi:hypothetical protein